MPAPAAPTPPTSAGIRAGIREMQALSSEAAAHAGAAASLLREAAEQRRKQRR